MFAFLVCPVRSGSRNRCYCIKFSWKMQVFSKKSAIRPDNRLFIVQETAFAVVSKDRPYPLQQGFCSHSACSIAVQIRACAYSSPRMVMSR